MTYNAVCGKAPATQGLLTHKLFVVVYNNFFTSVSFVLTQCILNYVKACTIVAKRSG